MINNNHEFKIVSDIYLNGIDVDTLSNEEFEVENLVEDGIIIRNVIRISTYDEFRESYNHETGKIDPTRTVINRNGSSCESITVDHHYDEIKEIYEKLYKETSDHENYLRRNDKY